MPDGAPFIDPDLVASRIATLLKDRRPGAVRPLLAALEKLAPRHQDLALLRSSYCSQTGAFAQALQVLDDAILQRPGNAELLLRRGEILFSQSDYANAATNAADAILAEPGLNRAKSVLGLALLKLGQFEQAQPCLAESFAGDPASVDVALALAALVPENAIKVLLRAIGAMPDLAVLRNALTRRYLCAGQNAQAEHQAAQTREAGLADAESFCLLAFAQMQQGKWDAADAAIAQAQILAPANPWAVRLGSALASRRFGAINPPRQHDALAAEQALFAGYTVLPGIFRAMVREANCQGPVLDLYCGTGLNAIAARDVCAGSWTGIDPDPELLKLSAERGLYDALENDEPLNALERGGQYSVILLNEALGYFADPASWFTALRGSLAAGGHALAAIPTGHPGLTGHALFAHDEMRIVEDANRAGLSVRLQHAGTLRHIEGIPLHGVFATFQTL